MHGVCACRWPLRWFRGLWQCSAQAVWARTRVRACTGRSCARLAPLLKTPRRARTDPQIIAAASVLASLESCAPHLVHFASLCITLHHSSLCAPHLAPHTLCTLHLHFRHNSPSTASRPRPRRSNLQPARRVLGLPLRSFHIHTYYTNTMSRASVLLVACAALAAACLLHAAAADDAGGWSQGRATFYDDNHQVGRCLDVH